MYTDINKKDCLCFTVTFYRARFMCLYNPHIMIHLSIIFLNIVSIFENYWGKTYATNWSFIVGLEIKIVLIWNNLSNILTFQDTKKWSQKHRRIFSQLRDWIQLPCEWQWKRHVFKRYKLNDKHAEWEIWKKKSWVLHNLVCRNGVLRIRKLFFVYLLRLYTYVLTVWLYLRGNWQAASYFEVCGHKVW